ncbi:MAG: hypothetical protein FWG34_05950 [Oscillospiraceae bacterium]|nr:hypothetical protein [Oscillospiraceae bacterium]
MDTREKFNRIMNFQETGSLPVLAVEPYEREIQALWETQGHLKKGQTPEEKLGMDSLEIIPVNFGPIPGFEIKKLWEDETYYIETEFMGGKVKRKKEAPSRYYGYIDHPVKSPEDWAKYKKRFACCPERVPFDLKEAAEKYAKCKNPVGIHLFPFFFRLGFYAMGMEYFMEAFYTEPEMMHDMFDHWSEFAIGTLRPMLEAVKPDFVTLTEDLAYKGATHTSPALYEKFWLPYQNKVVKLLEHYEIKIISLWSAGKLDGIMDMAVGNGINCTWPVERASGADPYALRKKYGKKLGMAGGIPTKALIGGPDEIDGAIEDLGPLIKQGGFFPALDDMVLPDISFENYAHCVKRLREIKI